MFGGFLDRTNDIKFLLVTIGIFVSNQEERLIWENFTRRKAIRKQRAQP
jgi:hypothetical protein